VCFFFFLLFVNVFCFEKRKQKAKQNFFVALINDLNKDLNKELLGVKHLQVVVACEERNKRN
jgi:hypothetical protein